MHTSLFLAAGMFLGVSLGVRDPDGKALLQIVAGGFFLAGVLVHLP